MLTSEFDYSLPDDRIAQVPAPRGTSRLLVLAGSGAVHHHRISDLPQLLVAGDLLVVNNTKVIPARLFGRWEGTGGRVELLLVERLGPTEWLSLVRPGRRARPGSRLQLGPGLEAEVLAKDESARYRLRFSAPIEPHLDRLGHVPLPPYIRREDRPDDRTSYQTVFARTAGAVAAPTAGLHFTSELLDELRRAGVGVAEVTLHVGLGTFKPVSVEQVEQHRMDAEWYELPEPTAAAIRETRRQGGRVVAVGTTVVRTLESVARKQGGEIDADRGTTDLFITPGYEYRVVDLLLTNFHLPRSTLLMLVCAFGGRERVLAAYQQAIETGYRFYSYGDAMLIEPNKTQL
ncbi:MAG: tRNA preQ1(34) S-adenosylmethionine ribosyltransferase-isomerase QueA [Thermoanaerobaculia bacterium]